MDKWISSWSYKSNFWYNFGIYTKDLLNWYLIMILKKFDPTEVSAPN
jgi:hypothetical protein